MAARALAAVALALATIGAAQADGIELRVRRDELPELGEWSWELSSHARRLRSADGSALSLTQGLLEVTYGAGRHWEAGLRLPAYQAVDATGATFKAMGAVGEVKFIAPHDDDEGPYWGSEIETGRYRGYRDAMANRLEWLAIVGWRVGAWHLAANPGLSWSSREEAGAGSRWSRGWNARLTRGFGAGWEAGVEWHQDREGAATLTGDGGRQRIALFTLEGRSSLGALNVGIGRVQGAGGSGPILRLQWDLDID